ncbi:MAG: hypothetical protein Q8N63_03795 [Nanoarchaeota archaeon]|nr:hypothetical protein [Nanoarchaeota archaeon]
MYIYDLLLGNRNFLKLIFTILIGLICFIIVLRTHKLFKLSEHQGIRYFRNAFFFYGLAFILRYLIEIVSPSVTKLVFEFFLIMAGFFLLYSLMWKKFEIEWKGGYSSLFNSRIFLFYALTLILVFLDYIWQSYCFMFGSQIILFIYASIISYINYKKSNGKGFAGLYFIVMLLNLIAWTANFVVSVFFGWYKPVVIGIYALNAIIFFIFLYGVLSVTRR